MLVLASRRLRPCQQVVFASFSTVPQSSSSDGKKINLTKYARPPEDPVYVKPARTPQQQYNVDRNKYRKEVSQLRRQWQVDFEAKWKRETEEKAAARKRIQLEQAINLRDFREKQRQTQERVKKEKAVAYQRYMAIRERNIAIIQDRRTAQQQRYKDLVEDMTRESEVWITRENMDQLICEDLFKGPCTTGLVTKESQQWRYEAIAFNWRRDTLPNIDVTTPRGTAIEMGQIHVRRREQVRAFLDPMVGTGEERKNFNSLVTKYMDMVEKGGFDEEADADHIHGVDALADHIELVRAYNEARELRPHERPAAWNDPTMEADIDTHLSAADREYIRKGVFGSIQKQLKKVEEAHKEACASMGIDPASRAARGHEMANKTLADTLASVSESVSAAADSAAASEADSSKKVKGQSSPQKQKPVLDPGLLDELRDLVTPDEIYNNRDKKKDKDDDRSDKFLAADDEEDETIEDYEDERMDRKREEMLKTKHSKEHAKARANPQYQKTMRKNKADSKEVDIDIDDELIGKDKDA